MSQQANRFNRTQNIILQLNKSGLSYLTHQQYSQAFEYFKQSQKIINNQLSIQPQNLRINKLAGICYNNLACYYKKTNKPKIALIYLQKALDIQVNKVQDWSATASTHLNICAIYSYIKQHQSAANHAQLAIQMLEKINQYQNMPSLLFNTNQNKDKQKDRDREKQKGKNGNNKVKKYTQQQYKSIANLNILAHYNLAIQLEYLKRYEKSIQQFIKARDLAKKIGKKHMGIIMVCDQSIVRLKQLMNTLKDRLVRLVTKKRQDQQKGYYQYMRLNKKNQRYKSKQRERINTSLAQKVKQLKIYEEKPYYRTKSIFRIKTQPKGMITQKQKQRSQLTNQRNSSFSHI